MTTRTRRRGPTCHRSVRRGQGAPQAAAIRLVPDVRSAAGARVVPAGPGLPLALTVPAVQAALAAAPRVPVALAAALRVLAAVPVAPVPQAALEPVLALLTATAVLAATAVPAAASAARMAALKVQVATLRVQAAPAVLAG